MTEFEKLKDWYEQEKEKGLRGFHVTLSNMLGFSEKVLENPDPYIAMLPEGVTLEDACREFNQIQAMIKNGQCTDIKHGDKGIF